MTTTNTVISIMVLPMVLITILGCLITTSNIRRVFLVMVSILVGTFAVVAARDIMQAHETPDLLTPPPPPRVTPAVVEKVPPTKVVREELLVLIDGDLLQFGAELDRREKQEAAASKAFLRKKTKRLNTK